VLRGFAEFCIAEAMGGLLKLASVKGSKVLAACMEDNKNVPCAPLNQNATRFPCNPDNLVIFASVGIIYRPERLRVHSISPSTLRLRIQDYFRTCGPNGDCHLSVAAWCYLRR
jgi:hypothetical protein